MSQTEQTTPEEVIEEVETTEAAPAAESTDTAEASTASAESTETANSAEDAMQQKLNDTNDRLLRTVAEYDNFRKRSVKEREQARTDAIAYAVKALLPTIDNLGRALAQPTEDAEYKKGIDMTYQQLIAGFASLNVKPIEAAKGTAFDPNFHNAVMHIESDELGENEIAEVFQMGFMIGEKVIRHAMVQVAN